MGTMWRHRRLQSVLVVLAFVVTASPAFGRAPTGRTLVLTDRTFAVATPGAPHDLAAVDDLASVLGRTPDSVVFYVAWSTGSDFPTSAAEAIASRGAVPEVTWEPWDPALGVVQPTYGLDRIVAGDHDAYVARWAEQIARYRKPVVMRFAHEMNGTWYPWAQQVNGNGP